MEQLLVEQLHYTSFQGNSSPKRKQFEAFLSDIRVFLLERIDRPQKIFFSYAWPKPQDDHNEAWHFEFIRYFQNHLVDVGVVASLDQIESVVAHNLNAFMQRIEQSDRVFVFCSKTLDEKLGWDKSGARHENNLILACESAKSLNKPFVLHIGLSDKCKTEPESFTRKNLPTVTDYLLLLKSVISETYGLGEEFEQYWQERLIAHKIMDMLTYVPAQAPNMVRRERLLSKLDEVLEEHDRVLCMGGAKSGKKQLCLSYVWDNYYRYRAVYWLRESDLEHIQIKSASLVFIFAYADLAKIKKFLNKKDSDTKIVLLGNFVKDEEISFFQGSGIVTVQELEIEESCILIKNILGEVEPFAWQSLVDKVGFKPEPLLLACGYIQRNRITVAGYLEHLKESPDKVAKFTLPPIRERKLRLGLHNNQNENSAPRLKRRAKPEEYSCKDLDAILQVAPPKPDDPKTEQSSFESQQSFCSHTGQAGFLSDIRFELDKLVLPQKIIFISFAFADILKEKWTETFVKSLAEHFQRAGATVYFMHQENLEAYVRVYQHSLQDIHVFVISTRSRLKDPIIREHDEMIKRCVQAFPELNKPNQRFFMPICLTSEKHYDEYYKPFGAYWFYGHEYLRQLRDLMGFIFWVDDSFREFWHESTLKHKIASNWWPNRPGENPNFVDRKDPVTGRSLLQRMHQHFWLSKELLVISTNGIGGVGKTQLALQFAHLYGYKFRHIFWFSAENSEALLQRYVELGTDNFIFALEEDKKLPIEEKARIVINWLQNVHQDWLLIVDNAKNHKEIKDWLPSQGGQILVTSRHTEWPGEHNISVGLFSLEEACEYIQKVLGRDLFEREVEQANQLIALLGQLPLAVAQACAYIKKQCITIAQYLELYKSKKKELQSSTVLSDAESHETLSITWAITLKEMEKEFPESVQMMNLCTQLHHENILSYIIYAFFQNGVVFRNSIRVASEYSMVNWNEEKEIISLHLLVHEVVQSNLTVDEAKRYLYLVYDLLTKCYLHDDKIESIIIRRFLLPHLEILLPKLEQHEEKLVDLSDLIAKVYNDSSDVKKVKELLDRALVVAERCYGREHENVMSILTKLGSVYVSLGDTQKGRAFLEEAFSFCQKTYGEEGLIVLNLLERLHNVYLHIGNVEKATEFLNRALLCAKKHYDDRDHPAVVRIRVSLAATDRVLGSTRRSKELLEQALVIYTKYYGENHPRIAETYCELGKVYDDLDDPRMSKNFFERALSFQKKFYGENHVVVMDTLERLGKVCMVLGDSQSSKVFLERALSLKEQYYGRSSPSVGHTLMSLGAWHASMNEMKEAKPLFERALIIFEKCCGEDHKNVARVLDNLGGVYGALGNAEINKKLLKRASNILEINFGKYHPEVGATLNNLASAYNKLKKFWRAIDACSRACAIFLQHPDRGSEHSFTKQSLNSLRLLRAQVKKICLEKNIAWENILYDISGLNQGAIESYRNRDYENAIKLYEKCLPLCFLQEIPDEENNAVMFYNLGTAYWKNNEYVPALNCLNQALKIRTKNDLDTEKVKTRIIEVEKALSTVSSVSDARAIAQLGLLPSPRSMRNQSDLNVNNTSFQHTQKK